MDILIGADPELFVKKNGESVSAYGLIDGDKKNPVKVNKGAVQVDGMALELNIDPAKDGVEFTENINTVLTELRNMVPKEYAFDISPVAHFGSEYIKDQPEAARELGCDPDYNTYTRAVNPRPSGDLGFRTASGHIHIGWTNNMDPMDPGHFEACLMATKQLDYLLYPLSLAWDEDRIRSSMYGKPGSFRPKPYGVEYRVLSNAWLKDPQISTFVANVTFHGIKQLSRGRKYYNSDEQTEYTPNFFFKEALDDNGQAKLNLNIVREYAQSWLSTSLYIDFDNIIRKHNTKMCKREEKASARSNNSKTDSYLSNYDTEVFEWNGGAIGPNGGARRGAQVNVPVPQPQDIELILEQLRQRPPNPPAAVPIEPGAMQAFERAMIDPINVAIPHRIRGQRARIRRVDNF